MSAAVELTQNRISEYETGKGEPPLPILLLYARAVNVSTDVSIDDEPDLPEERAAKKRAE